MRVIKALFWLSDICAWTLLFLTTLFALTNFVGAPILAAMDHVSLSGPKTIAGSFGLLLVAGGAYGITRRKPLALFLVLIPTMVAVINGALQAAIISLSFVLLVFGLPFLLVFLKSRTRLNAEKI